MTVSTMDEEQEVMTQEDEVLRGRKARVLMRDPMVVEALKSMDRAFYHAFRDTEPENVEQLSRIRLLIKCLDEFRGFFEIAITTGKLTQENMKLLDQEERALENLERQRLNR